MCGFDPNEGTSGGSPAQNSSPAAPSGNSSPGAVSTAPQSASQVVSPSYTAQSPYSQNQYERNTMGAQPTSPGAPREMGYYTQNPWVNNPFDSHGPKLSGYRFLDS